MEKTGKKKKKTLNTEHKTTLSYGVNRQKKGKFLNNLNPLPSDLTGSLNTSIYRCITNASILNTPRKARLA